jgi:hypothetical protein
VVVGLGEVVEVGGFVVRHGVVHMLHDSSNRTSRHTILSIILSSQSLQLLVTAGWKIRRDALFVDLTVLRDALKEG